MSETTPPTPATARPQVQVDPSIPAKRLSTLTNNSSPQSAIIDIPPGWIDSPASGSRSTRGSMDVDPIRRSMDSVSRSHLYRHVLLLTQSSHPPIHPPPWLLESAHPTTTRHRIATLYDLKSSQKIHLPRDPFQKTHSRKQSQALRTMANLLGTIR
jgi:hypothetical protein